MTLSKGALLVALGALHQLQSCSGYATNPLPLRAAPSIRTSIGGRARCGDASAFAAASCPTMSMVEGGVDRRSLIFGAFGAAISSAVAAAPTGAEATLIGRKPKDPKMIPLVKRDDGFDGVRQDVWDMIDKDRDFAPTLVRLGFHSSGTYDKMSRTGGSSKGTIRFKEEFSTEANAGLQSCIERLEAVKIKHPECSYADLYTLAATVGVESLEGPLIPWRGGRKDTMSRKDVPPDGRLPDPDYGDPKKTITKLRQRFGRMGFNDQELVALSGAHTIGQCHYEATSYVGVWSEVHLRFDNAYFNVLLQPTFESDPENPVESWQPHELFGKLQYGDALFNYMMLPSDLALVQDPKTLEYVKLYANNAPRFFKDFAAAYGKLLALGTDQ